MKTSAINIWSKKNGSRKTYYSGEKNYRDRGGKLISVEVNANFISYDNKRIYCINVKNISEKKRAEAESNRLSIVAHNVIVEKHKGHLTLETEQDSGTTFIIRLPIENNCSSDFVK